MKPIISALVGFAVLVASADAATPVTEENAWQETYAVDTAEPRLVISNIWGGIQVRTGAVGQISVSAVELRSAPDQERFDRSLETLLVNIEADAYGASFQVGDPNEHRNQFDNCRGCRLDVQFEVVVPPGTIVDVGTVMDGSVDVRDVAGTVTARNVNGPVDVDGIQDCESIESVNGKVNVGFSKTPAEDCNIETVNGDITLDVPAGTGMDVTLDLFNGEIVSELMAGPLDLSATVEHTTKNGHSQYRIQKLTGLRIGAGGPTYSISSINGDVRIQKHQ
jgi:hypothetical protein